jgi:hypothetical protein
MQRYFSEQPLWFDQSPKRAIPLECIVYLLRKEVLKELLAKYPRLPIEFEFNPITDIKVIWRSATDEN